MHNLVKLAAGITALTLTAGCSGGGIRVTETEKAYETGNSQVKASLPRFECSANPEFAEDMNREYDELIMSVLDEFIARTQNKTEKSDFTLETDVKMNNGRLLSVVCDGEVKSEDAHGERFRVCRTIDFIEGKTLTLSDIFADEEWKRAVDAKMEQLAKSGKDEYEDLWEMPSTKLLKSENFYINDKGIVFFFPPYELSYYRRGFVEFEFSHEELSGYFSEAFREMVI